MKSRTPITDLVDLARRYTADEWRRRRIPRGLIGRRRHVPRARPHRGRGVMADGRPLRGRWSEYRTPGFVPTTFVDEVRHALLTAGEYHVEATGRRGPVASLSSPASSRRCAVSDTGSSRFTGRGRGSVGIRPTIRRRENGRRGGRGRPRNPRASRSSRRTGPTPPADVARAGATPGTDARGRGDAPGRLRRSRRRRGRIPGGTGLRSSTRSGATVAGTRAGSSRLISRREPFASAPRRGDPDDLLTATDAARILHVSTETVYRMLRSHTLPPRHIGPSGRLVRVRRGDVWEYLDRPEVET